MIDYSLAMPIPLVVPSWEAVFCGIKVRQRIQRVKRLHKCRRLLESSEIGVYFSVSVGSQLSRLHGFDIPGTQIAFISAA